MSCCFLADFMNSVGLAFDILGVILLFRYGLPPDVRPGRKGTNVLFGGGDTPAEIEKKTKRYKSYQRNSWVALGFLVLGFTLQIVSNWL